MQRKLERRDNQLEQAAEENQTLNKQICHLEDTVKALQRRNKGTRDSRRHFRVAAGNLKSCKDDMQKQISQLELENEDLRCQLDDIMNDGEICAFENGKYTSDIRMTCFELLSKGVSSRNVSDIIRIVLQDVAKMRVGRLPKPTLIRYLAVEQAMLSKEAARDNITTSQNPVTLQVDRTSKKRKSYTTFLASTDAGTVGMSLHDISTESADVLIQETEETLNELVALNITDNKNQAHELL